MKRTERNTYQLQLLATLLLLATAFVLSACSSDDSDTPSSPNSTDSEIRLNTEVWQVMEGTRATTYDNSNFNSFICVAYNHETATSPYIDHVQVNKVSSTWTFDGGSRYWPASGTLDFFAYAPTGNIPSYITTGPTYSYSSGQQMTFTCTLPTTGATQGGDVKEFVYAFAANQDKTSNSGNGVNLTFSHPFARIYFKRGTVNKNGTPVESSVVQISQVTLKSIYKTGTYNSSSQWGSLENFTNFSLTGANVPTEGNGPYLVVPQTFNSSNNFVVQLKYKDGWGITETKEFETTVNTEWEPGYSYTYTISASITVSGGGGGGGSDGITVDVNKFTEQW